jgi:hypothetical protein
MKKVLLTLSIFAVSLAAFAQDTISADYFNKKYANFGEKIEQVYNEKNYLLGIKEYNLILADFHKLSIKTQQGSNSMLGSSYFNMALLYSLLNKKKDALSALEKSAKVGYEGINRINFEPDFDNIRKEKRFIALQEGLTNYLKILRSAGNYQKENTDTLPKFTYQSAEIDNLQNVKKYFNLDSVAGNGDEISKIINLMLFVYQNIKWDGSNYALCEWDAIDFYNYHKATGKGINCRHISLTLNELYLAMGFKSRYVTCLPKFSDGDCHVINCVYSETLKKWLYMDASFGIYLTDENNNLLSISEVRDKLIKNEPLNLNKETTQTKEWYLDYYMAKNLYWFQCATIYRFNVESRYRKRDSDLKYVILAPVGFESEQFDTDTDIVTHDDNYFWQTPE